MSRGGQRRIVLCADDYGISPAVSAAIRDLIGRGRLNATSVMVVAPRFDAAAAAALQEVAAKRAAIGLHVTLTAPFAPLSRGYAPLRNGAFLPLAATAGRALARLLKPDLLAAEITRQLSAFREVFGVPPDFVDGHQHIHVFPQIREALLGAVKDAAPDAWVRQCARAADAPRPLSDPKGLVLDGLSRGFARLAAAHGVRTNSAFSGTYSFRRGADYPALFPGFLEGLPDRGVIMCHPGKVDDELRRLDPLTDLREMEYAYFAGDAFARLLATRNVALQ
jgi:hypothetical protein